VNEGRDPSGSEQVITVQGVRAQISRLLGVWWLSYKSDWSSRNGQASSPPGVRVHWVGCGRRFRGRPRIREVRSAQLKPPQPSVDGLIPEPRDPGVSETARSDVNDAFDCFATQLSYVCNTSLSGW
jgi:hypothetical protein